MVRYHAAWILPMSDPPVRDGWVAVDRDRVVAYGSDDRRAAAQVDRDVDLGQVAVLPGLVNAHTHLELSFLRGRVAAHAPYSVAPLVLREIRRALDRDPFATCSVHLAESAEEVEFIRSGGGPWRDLLEELGVWDAAWTAPGVTPVQYLADCGFLN